MNNFNFEIVGGRDTNEGNKGIMKKKKEKNEVNFPARFKSEEKYLYLSRIAYFHQQSINEVLDDLAFGRNWKERNEEYKAKQVKLGVSDKEIITRRKKRIRLWHVKKAA